MDNPPVSPDEDPVSGEKGVDPSLGGAPWWAYRRPPVSRVERARRTPALRTRLGPRPERTTVPDADASEPGSPPQLEPPSRTPLTEWVPSGQPAAIVAISLVVATIIATRGMGLDSAGAWLLPGAGLAAAVAFGQRCRRVHPDEPWLPQLLLLGVVVKLAASWLRWYTLTDAYDGVGDASRFDLAGRRLVAEWTGGPPAPQLDNLRQTNFLKWLTGITYYLFGQSLVGGFLLFGLIAVIGSYFWYRALVDAVPFTNRRLFLIFMMFAPSVVFWPSSLGKEALMQLGVGAVAWATSLALRGRFVAGIPLMAGGGWLLWIVRPHLLALVTLAAAVPYFLGRFGGAKESSFFTRPVGMVAVALLVVFTITSGAKFLGIEKLSVESVQEQLDEETARSQKGGSQFSHPGNTLNPIFLPLNAVTVLFRPFIWEARSGFQLLAALESSVVIFLIVKRFESVRFAFQRCRRWPFLLYCWILLALYCMTFAAIANFGLLNRQRSLVLPALYALIAVEPALARAHDRANGDPESAPLER
jgi:hypothetical protein